MEKDRGECYGYGGVHFLHFLKYKYIEPLTIPTHFLLMLLFAAIRTRRIIDMEEDQGECYRGVIFFLFYFIQIHLTTHHPPISFLLSCETKEGGGYEDEGEGRGGDDPSIFIIMFMVIMIIIFIMMIVS